MSKNKKPMSLAQHAGALCNNKNFWQWGLFNNASEAAIFIRRACGITSRKDLQTNVAAAMRYDKILSDFKNWEAEQQHADNLSRM